MTTRTGCPPRSTSTCLRCRSPCSTSPTVKVSARCIYGGSTVDECSRACFAGATSGQQSSNKEAEQFTFPFDIDSSRMIQMSSTTFGLILCSLVAMTVLSVCSLLYAVYQRCAQDRSPRRALEKMTGISSKSVSRHAADLKVW